MLAPIFRLVSDHVSSFCVRRGNLFEFHSSLSLYLFLFKFYFNGNTLNLKKLSQHRRLTGELPDRNFNPEDLEESRKKLLVSFFTYSFSLYLIIYSIIDIFIIRHFFGYITLTALLAGTLNYYLFKKNRIHRETASSTIIVFSMIIFSTIFYLGGIDYSGIFWMLLFPPLCFFLKGGKKGFWLTSLFLLILALLYFYFLPALNRPYPLRYTLVAFSVYFLSAVFSFFYESTLREYFAIIKEKTQALHRSQKQTEEAKEELSKMNEIKDKMFTVLSHDLRGSFGSIKNYAAFILDEYKHKEDKKLSESLEIILLSCHSTYDLLNNLLEWSKMQIDRLDCQPSVFSINDLIDNALVAHQAPAHFKAISLTALSEGQYMVRADRNMIELVIRNLLSNALKFTPFGGTIQLKTSLTPKGVRVSIQDSGVGINPELLKQLERLEHYVSQPGTQGEKGAGLGLSLAREYLKQNASQLEIASTLGQGTNISFLLQQKSF